MTDNNKDAAQMNNLVAAVAKPQRAREYGPITCSLIGENVV